MKTSAFCHPFSRRQHPNSLKILAATTHMTAHQEVRANLAFVQISGRQISGHSAHWRWKAGCLGRVLSQPGIVQRGCARIRGDFRNLCKKANELLLSFGILYSQNHCADRQFAKIERVQHRALVTAGLSASNATMHWLHMWR